MRFDETPSTSSLDRRREYALEVLRHHEEATNHNDSQRSKCQQIYHCRYPTSARNDEAARAPPDCAPPQSDAATSSSYRTDWRNNHQRRERLSGTMKERIVDRSVQTYFLSSVVVRVCVLNCPAGQMIPQGLPLFLLEQNPRECLRSVPCTTTTTMSARTRQSPPTPISIVLRAAGWLPTGSGVIVTCTNFGGDAGGGRLVDLAKLPLPSEHLVGIHVLLSPHNRDR